jgi:hypothetical protein
MSHVFWDLTSRSPMFVSVRVLNSEIILRGLPQRNIFIFINCVKAEITAVGDPPH